MLSQRYPCFWKYWKYNNIQLVYQMMKFFYELNLLKFGRLDRWLYIHSAHYLCDCVRVGLVKSRHFSYVPLLSTTNNFVIQINGPNRCNNETKHTRTDSHPSRIVYDSALLHVHYSYLVSWCYFAGITSPTDYKVYSWTNKILFNYSLVR